MNIAPIQEWAGHTCQQINNISGLLANRTVTLLNNSKDVLCTAVKAISNNSQYALQKSANLASSAASSSQSAFHSSIHFGQATWLKVSALAQELFTKVTPYLQYASELLQSPAGLATIFSIVALGAGGAIFATDNKAVQATLTGAALLAATAAGIAATQAGIVPASVLAFI
ncbi:MAG: hypothetical protein CMO81_07785 [Waddliaceae bacterium]|nr:hypothetical protein [Waddliaceae bacterium]